MTKRPALALALAASAFCAWAQQPLPDDAALRAWLDPQLAATAAREGLSRYELQVGAPRLPASAASCTRSELFLPAGARPWGRISIGLRCVEGAHWTVLVPATVAVWGPATVAASALPAGAVLGDAQLQAQEVELTREPPGVRVDPAQLAGRTLLRAVAPGQPLRLDMTRATPVVQAGDSVRLAIKGRGFSIAASGQALGTAGVGQSVRVRTDMGKILNGVAREGRIIEVTL